MAKSDSWEYTNGRASLSDWLAGAVVVGFVGLILVSAVIAGVSFLRTGEMPDAPADTTSDEAVCEQFWLEDLESSGGMAVSHRDYMAECLRMAEEYRDGEWGTSSDPSIPARIFGSSRD